MNWFTAIVVYVLLWWIVLFAVLPWGIRTAEESNLKAEPGLATSAPMRPRIGLKFLITSGIAAILFGVYYIVQYYDLIGFRAMMR